MADLHKDDVIALHGSLLQMRRYVEATSRGARPELFEAYDRFGVSPLHVHRDRGAHERAVFLLSQALACATSETVRDAPGVEPEALRGLREADEEVARHAHRLLGKKSDVDLRVLRRLEESPQRYRDLKTLLEGAADNHLTVALERLQDDGLVRRTSDLAQAPPVHVYVPTELGLQVLAAIRVLWAALPGGHPVPKPVAGSAQPSEPGGA